MTIGELKVGTVIEQRKLRGLPYSVVGWDAQSAFKTDFYLYNGGTDLKVFKVGKLRKQDCIFVDTVNYDGDRYLIFRIKDLIKAGIVQENNPETPKPLPAKWKLKINKIEDVEDYLIAKYGKVDNYILNDIHLGMWLYSEEAFSYPPKYVSTTPNLEYTTITLKQFKEHFSNMKKDRKIIAYELLKDLPNKVLKGTKATLLDGHYSFESKENSVHVFSESEILDTEWFKPVYEEAIKTKTVKLGNRDIVINSKGEMKGPENSYKIEDIEYLRDNLIIENLQVTNNTTGLTISIDFLTIGCEKNCTFTQLQELIYSYYQLNPQK